MRSLFTFVSLLVVLAIVAVLVRQQLHASTRAAAAAGAASMPVDAAHASQAVDQYRQSLDQAIKADAAHTADQAASAGDDGTR